MLLWKIIREYLLEKSVLVIHLISPSISLQRILMYHLHTTVKLIKRMNTSPTLRWKSLIILSQSILQTNYTTFCIVRPCNPWIRFTAQFLFSPKMNLASFCFHRWIVDSQKWNIAWTIKEHMSWFCHIAVELVAPLCN